jgi:prostatic aicd phosphatase
VCSSICLITITIFLCLSAFGCFVTASRLPLPRETLVLVHALFRHGNRTPDYYGYKNNPITESDYPETYGQLTNEGKRTEYSIGTTLRQRYNRFLGPTWNINYIDARTTNVNRTKMSLELMLAGLWPPSGTQRWQPRLKWQPIPYNYLTNDKELQSTNVCTNYNTLYKEALNSDEVQEALSVYDEHFKYISDATGEDFSTPDSIFNLYFTLVTQSEYGYPLEDWTKPIYPEVVTKIAKDVYYIGTNTTELKKLSGGFLLRKIINDSKAKIDGLLTPQSRKMFLYSAHESNVAKFLRTLDVYDDNVPAYGAHVLVELHLIRGVYGFQVYYQDWSTRQPRLLTIPGCRSFCPIDEFVSLLEEVIPEDDDCTTS